MNKIWIVEMLSEINLKWVATVGARLTREAAREEKREWHKRNPGDKFQVRKYVAVNE